MAFPPRPLLLSLALSGTALGQTVQYCDPPTAGMWGTQGTSCPLPSEAPSICWQVDSTCEGGLSPEWTGFPLNLCLWTGVTPGDFAPRKLALPASSSPLVSRGSGTPGPLPYMERPTLLDQIDLITGQPLLQEIDFELPFGGAVFRHVRTYSEELEGLHEHGCYDPTAADLFWDWQGQGWMMGENPVFLFDASYWGMIADGSTEPATPTRCYFIPDAHHAIPFERVISSEWTTPRYVAPPRFDAIMTYEGGTWNATTEEWTTPPTTFHIWLHGKAIKYTIELQPGDVTPLLGGGSAHDRPLGQPVGNTDPVGVPYWGLVTKIEDRNGNEVLMDYCDFGPVDADDPATTGCHECHQNCNEKGQLTRVRLRSEGQTVWTLLYTYRSFTDELLWANSAYWYRWHQQQALHSIHVYEGEEAIPTSDSCLTIDATEFEYPSGIDPDVVLAGLDQVDAVSMLSLPIDWVYEVKYLYTEDDINSPRYADVFGRACESPGGDPVHGSNGSPRLLKTTLTHRPEGTGTGTVSYRLYRYERHGDAAVETDPVGITAVYGPETVEAIRHALGTGSPLVPAHVNELILAENDDNVTITDPETQVADTRRFDRWADLQFRHWDHTITGEAGYGSSAEFIDDDNDLADELVDGVPGMNGGFAYLPLQRDRLLFHPSGKYVVGVREGFQTRYFKLYRFMHLPQSLGTPPQTQWFQSAGDPNNQFFRAVHHHPYRFIHDTEIGTPANWQVHADQSQPMWVTVVDEHGTLEECQADFVSGSGTQASQWTARRVVQMNSQGSIVKDKTWSGDGALLNNKGIAEEYVYDSEGRITERRTKGWGTPANLNQGTQGLVYVFGYDQYQQDNDRTGVQYSSEIGRVGIKMGSDEQSNPVYWLSRIERHADRPELVTRETLFTEPVTDYLNPPTGSASVTETTYTLVDDTPGSGEAFEQRIADKMVVRPKAAREEGGTLYHAVEKEIYDEEGRLVWRGYGSLANAALVSTSTGDQFFWDYTEFDDYGRVDLEVVDADSSRGGGYPTGFLRNDPEGSLPLDHETDYIYGFYGLQQVKYPNGRNQYIGYDEVALPTGPGMEQRIYKDVVDGATSNDAFRALSPMTVNYIQGGQVLRSLEARITNQTHQIPQGIETYEIINELTPEYDPQGRLVKATRAGTDGSEVDAAVHYDGFGNVVRQRDANGNITRTVFDHLGFKTHVYRGTKDLHVYWGTAGPSGPFDDDLILVEKSYYGTGVRDAHELTAVRRFRDKPTNQYDPGASNEESIGWLEELGYDDRMRQVWSRQKDASGNALSHTATFLDHADRVRFAAVYGATGPTGLADPRELDAGDDVPTAAQILQSTPAPLRLSETIYDDRGQVQEQREYNVADTSGASYLATLTFYDHAGRTVWSRRPGAGIDLSAYDAKGRLRLRRQVVDGLEVTREEILDYSADGNPEEVRRYERLHAGSGTSAALDATNAVRTRTFNWFDHKNRLLATAELGTESADGSFTNGTMLPRLGEDDPSVYDGNGQLTGFNPGNLGAAAKITCYEYDGDGRQTAVAHADGSVTRYGYSDLGELLGTWENWTPTASVNDTDSTITTYTYDRGRLVRMTAVVFDATQVPWYRKTNGQVTEFVYGADVVDSTLATLTTDGGLVSEVRFPDPATGQASTVAALTFQYYPTGQLATRADARGTTFRHTYDEAGNRTRTLVQMTDTPAPPGGVPADRVRRIDYAFDVLGQLTKATAYRVMSPADPNADTDVVAQTVLEYDPRGNLLKDWQEHGRHKVATSPVVDYAWSYAGYTSSGGNYDRPSTITYPDRDQTSNVLRRVLTLGYGDTAGSIDDVLGRITRIDDATFGTASIAAYAYTGGGRRVSAHFDYVGGSSPSYAAGQAFPLSTTATGYTGLDRHGRVADLHYQDLLGVTQLRAQQGWDGLDQRLFTKLTQATLNGTPHDNDRSWLYAYDPLHRLETADRGYLDLSGAPLIRTQTGDPTPREMTWLMDRLGNWAGDGTDPGLTITGDLYGTGVVTREVTHDAAFDNRLESVTTDPGDGSGSSAQTLRHDAAGNLILDGSYWYQYDGWNRLVQVAQRGTLDLDSNGDYTGTPGPWVVHYTYDPLGRLIRRQSPYTAPSPTETRVRTERYFYEGIRRIQEVFTDPLSDGGDDPLLMSLEAQAVNPGEGLQDGGAGLLTVTTQTWTEREYVWGPEGVDELVCQIKPVIGGTDVALYALLDSSGSVSALVDRDGDVLEQYTFDPYGDLLTVETATGANVPRNRVAHQGLFLDRFDGGTTLAVIVVGAKGLYQNRNRSYSPELGRFVQKDPNETALPLVIAAMHGRAAFGALGGFDEQGMYGDGMSLYGYLGNNPLNRSDPLGLSWDPFEMVDDYIATDAGSKAAFMAELQQGFDTTLYIGLQVAQLHPAVGAAVALYKVANGTASGLDLLSLVPGGKGLGTIVKAMGSKGVYAAQYVGRGIKRGMAGTNLAFDMAAAVKKLRMAKGKRNNVDVPSQEEAMELMQRALPDLPIRNTYRGKSEGFKFGFEIHGPEKNVHTRAHIKFYDWRNGKGGYEGHIFWDMIKKDGSY